MATVVVVSSRKSLQRSITKCIKRQQHQHQRQQQQQVDRKPPLSCFKMAATTKTTKTTVRCLSYQFSDSDKDSSLSTTITSSTNNMKHSTTTTSTSPPSPTSSSSTSNNKANSRNFSSSSTSIFDDDDHNILLDDPNDINNNNNKSKPKKRLSASAAAIIKDVDARASSAAVSQVDPECTHQRIWLPHSLEEPLYWSDDVVHHHENESNPHNLAKILERIETQELEGGRMLSKQYGVLHEDPAVDMRLLTENYTVTSLASALRDREDALQFCAQLAERNEITALKNYLANFHPQLVEKRRKQTRRLDVSNRFNATSLETIRKALMRMPRRVTQAHARRAGVVLAICHVNGIPSLLLEKRSASLRAHPDEVCLPGGMVCSVADKTIVETCLREMQEEIGGLDFNYHRTTTTDAGNGNNGNTSSTSSSTGIGHGISVLGVLRCNWGEVHHMVGVAVTPVVCFLHQDLAEVDLKPNPEEVAEVFTIPLSNLMDKSQWIYKEDHAPIFIGGPYVIWGLTGYILERFWKDVLMPFNVKNTSTD